MDRKRIIGWWMFDWASQPYYTLGLTFIFGPYFASVAAESFMAGGLSEIEADANAQSLWSLGQTITGLLIALTAPVLGAFADHAGRRMPWIVLFSLFYVGGAAGLWFVMPDGSNLVYALMVFGIGLIGAEFTTIFTNALLPDMGPREETGKLSGTGFAIGYVGGVTALFIMLLFFAEGDSGRTLLGWAPAFGLDPEALEGTRFVGPFMAIWYIVAMIPFFLWVREAPGTRQPGGASRALANLVETLRTLPKRPSLFAYLGSSMFYRDALNALYSFGGTYAALVLNWPVRDIGIFGIIAAIASAIATWLGGKIDSARGPKPVIIAMIVLLLAVATFIPGITPEAIWGISVPSAAPNIAFFICGALIGAAGGVVQSSSRTLMVRHCEPDRPTEAFGLYALSGKATAFLGPFLIFVATLAFGDARFGVVPLIGLFALGLILLIWVNPQGRVGSEAAA
ncbi:MAG: MFS transporter [Pseudomonadota bacterium]